MMACEQCGAVYHGNINCIICVRWNIRYYREVLGEHSPMLRHLVTLWRRKLGIYHPDAWKDK